MIPYASGARPDQLHVYTIEECQSCKEKTKRDFKVGDYILGDAGTCGKCQGTKIITMIYGEEIIRRGQRNPQASSAGQKE